MEENNITIDENGFDDLGINIEEFILNFLNEQPDGYAHEDEIVEAYGERRYERTIELAMDELVKEGLAEYRICPETGEKLFKVHKNAKLVGNTEGGDPMPS